MGDGKALTGASKPTNRTEDFEIGSTHTYRDVSHHYYDELKGEETGGGEKLEPTKFSVNLLEFFLEINWPFTPRKVAASRRAGA